MSDGPGQRFTRAEGTDWLTSYFARMMPQAEQWFAGQATGQPAPEPQGGGFLIPPGLRSDIIATKLSASILVPNELLGEAPPRKYPPLARRQRFRQWRTRMRDRAAYRAFKIIAGYDVPEQEDW